MVLLQFANAVVTSLCKSERKTRPLPFLYRIIQKFALARCNALFANLALQEVFLKNSCLLCDQSTRSAVRSSYQIKTLTDYDVLGRAWRTRSSNGSCGAVTPPGSIITLDAANEASFNGIDVGSSMNLDITQFDTAANGLGAAHWSKRKQTSGDNYNTIDVLEQRSTFDALGRAQSASSTLSPSVGVTETYTTSTTYDPIGRTRTATDATGGTVENMYTKNGFMVRIRDANNPSTVYWELLKTNHRGQAVKEWRNKNVKLMTQRSYHAQNGRLTGIQTGEFIGSTLDTNSAIQNLGYSYDSQGNLFKRNDARLNKEERFGYDALNRLVQSWVGTLNQNGTPQQGLALSYDALGNICTKQIGSGEIIGYQYAGAAGCGLAGLGGSANSNTSQSPHAVIARINANGTTKTTYQYDAGGYQTSADYINTSENAKDRNIRYNVDGLADQFTNATETSHFRYAPGGRYLQHNIKAGVTTTTRYLGGVEWITKSNAVNQFERRRYVGGFLIIKEMGNTVGSGTSAIHTVTQRQEQYQFGDHLGSTDVLTDAQGNVIERMSFDAHGSRRDASSWLISIGIYTPTNTTHGFTGHEMLDGFGIIHMNGRIYDPELGRMLSPDPIVQEMVNLQNLNRYSYVLNNPLSLTDPTGLSWLGENWRSVGAVVIVIAAAIITHGASLEGTDALLVAMGAGAVSSAVACACAQGAVTGAFSALLFWGIGEYFQSIADANPQGLKFVGDTGLTPGQYGAKVAAHGVAGGIMSTIQGGKFGHGFASAGMAQLFSPAIGQITGDSSGAIASRITVAAFIGGTTSAMSGGKFANGALTAAFVQAFNFEAHEGGESKSDVPTISDEMGPPAPTPRKTLSQRVSKSVGDFFEEIQDRVLPAMGPVGMEASFGLKAVGSGALIIKASSNATNIARLGYNANRLNKVFAGKHMLDPLVQKFGSQEAALVAIHNAFQFVAKNPSAYQTGAWVTRQIGGVTVSVKGAIIENSFRISTATANQAGFY